MKKIIGLLFVGMFISGACHATPREKFEEMSELVGIPTMLDDTYQNITITVGCEKGMSFEDENIFRKKLVEVLDFKPYLNTFFQFMDENYTEEEIDQLIAFYKTDLGKKNLKLMPKYMQLASQELVKLIQEKLPQIDELTKEYPIRPQNEINSCLKSRLGGEK